MARIDKTALETMLASFSAKASHDGQYAIATALLVIAYKIDALGFNDEERAKGSAVPGTTEKIAMELAGLVSAVGRLERDNVL